MRKKLQEKIVESLWASLFWTNTFLSVYPPYPTFLTIWSIMYLSLSLSTQFFFSIFPPVSFLKKSKVFFYFCSFFEIFYACIWKFFSIFFSIFIFGVRWLSFFVNRLPAKYWDSNLITVLWSQNCCHENFKKSFKFPVINCKHR